MSLLVALSVGAVDIPGRAKLPLNYQSLASKVVSLVFKKGLVSILYCAYLQIRHAKILSGGGVETSLLGSHDERAHKFIKLAVEPGSPHILYLLRGWNCANLEGLMSMLDSMTYESLS